MTKHGKKIKMEESTSNLETTMQIKEGSTTTMRRERVAGNDTTDNRNKKPSEMKMIKKEMDDGRVADNDCLSDTDSSSSSDDDDELKAAVAAWASSKTSMETHSSDSASHSHARNEHETHFSFNKKKSFNLIKEDKTLKTTHKSCNDSLSDAKHSCDIPSSTLKINNRQASSLNASSSIALSNIKTLQDQLSKTTNKKGSANKSTDFSLHITQLPYEISATEVRELFQNIGCSVQDVRMVYDYHETSSNNTSSSKSSVTLSSEKKVKKFRGVAFVDVSDQRSFDLAIQELHKKAMTNNRKINVRPVRTKDELAAIVQATKQKVKEQIKAEKLKQQQRRREVSVGNGRNKTKTNEELISTDKKHQENSNLEQLSNSGNKRKLENESVRIKKYKAKERRKRRRQISKQHEARTMISEKKDEIVSFAFNPVEISNSQQQATTKSRPSPDNKQIKSNENTTGNKIEIHKSKKRKRPNKEEDTAISQEHFKLSSPRKEQKSSPNSSKSKKSKSKRERNRRAAILMSMKKR